ncbi:MAG TPA: hypothetical protein VMF56_07395 [Acidobacteriaceae bacterium]|nr:hypothetical protein [Acidobacteriaceae bacterium]
MARRSKVFVVAAWLLAAVWLAPASPSLCQKGYTGADLQRMGQWLQFYHLVLYKLEIPPYASPYAAALTSGKHGWRIVVFLRDGGVTNVSWDSGYLKRPFQAASTDDFVLTPGTGTNFGVSFSGCDARDCAANYGALLYLPWSHQFFQKGVAGHSVACSESLLDPANGKALQMLNAALRRQQADVPHYVAQPCPGIPKTTH